MSRGTSQNLVTIEFPYRMLYDGKVVTKTRCHKKVADSLLRVLKSIQSHFEALATTLWMKQPITRAVSEFPAEAGRNDLPLHAWGAGD
jgi:hypothetical protein